MPLNKQQTDELIEILKIQTLSTIELESRIGQYLDLEPGEMLTLERMNFSGGLRGQGYIVPRKRGEYRIIGFEKPKWKVGASEWPYELQDILTQFNYLVKVEQTHESVVALREYFKSYNDPTHFHEHSALYILSYENNDRQDVRWAQGGGIVVKKFEEQPRFHYIAPTIWALGDQRRLFEKVSCKPIKALATGSEVIPHLKAEGWKGELQDRQAIYDIEWLTTKLFNVVNSRARSYLKRNLRELELRDLTVLNIKDAYKVIDQWRAGPAGQKQRRLAIKRDYTAIDLATDPRNGIWGFIIYRNGVPVDVEILDRLPDHKWAACIVTKGLNYQDQPGGYPWTSVASLLLACYRLHEQSVQFINAGACDGGTPGLLEHKLMLANGAPLIHMNRYVSPVPGYQPGFKE